MARIICYLLDFFEIDSYKDDMTFDKISTCLKGVTNVTVLKKRPFVY